MSDFTIGTHVAARRILEFISVEFLSSLVITVFITISSLVVPAQQHSDNNVDQTLRGIGRVNGSTLGLEISIPLGKYPGRGIDTPVSINYSSKVWRTEFINSQPRTNNPESCIEINTIKYSERSSSGWTSSLAIPFIEYTGADNLYNERGFALSEGCQTSTSDDGEALDIAYVKRLMVHLPGGESHELRASDDIVTYPQTDQQADFDFNETFYSVDSTNLRYVEDAPGSTFRLLLPDGSFYVFASAKERLDGLNSPLVRRALSFTDRNGNRISYDSDLELVTDTLGRQLASPFGNGAPDSPTPETSPQIYSLLGLGSSKIRFKFHWKRLNGGSQAESALTDIGHPNYQLKYLADRSSPNPAETPRSAGYLFGSEWESWVHDEGQPLFNPVVLTKIELPSGLSYRFSYDIHGRIERIDYPAGAVEEVKYAVVPALTATKPDNVQDQTNFGVIERRVYPNPSSDHSYQWAYGAKHVSPAGFNVTTVSPEKIKTVRLLHRSPDPDSNRIFGSFGFGDALAGMAYEELVYDRGNKLVAARKTKWIKSVRPIGNFYGSNQMAEWHPRIRSIESFVFDPGTGVGLSEVKRHDYEIEAELNKIDTPVMLKRISEYGYENAGNSTDMADIGTDPDPRPTPVELPLPQTLIRTKDYKFLINDPTVPSQQRAVYKSKNLVGLVSAVEDRDEQGRLVSRSESLFDQVEYSPSIGRGNQTTVRIWDSSIGESVNPDAYVSRHNKFDTYGNKIESIDGLGNTTSTQFDTSHHAYPTKISSPIPDPSGIHGSNTAHETSTTFDSQTGLVLKAIDINGLETHFDYDPETLRLRRTEQFQGRSRVGGVKEILFVDEPGNVSISTRTQIDETNWSETIDHMDGLGRVRVFEKKHTQGNILVEKEFNSEGRLGRVSSPYRQNERKIWTTYKYDDSGRVIEVIGPDGTSITTNFGVLASDRKGTTKTVTDQAGTSRMGVLDAAGRTIRVVEDPDGTALITDYVFDSSGRIRKTKQGAQSRYFFYDSLGRLNYSKQPEENTNPQFEATDPVTGNSSWSQRFEHDANGNLIRSTDARNVSTSVDYDALSRALRRNYSDSTPAVSFFYDGTGVPNTPGRSKGKLTKTSSSVSESMSLSFDELGRVREHEQVTGNMAYRTLYEYNLAGQLVAETYPSGRRFEYDLDENGELAGVRGRRPDQISTTLYVDRIERNTSGAVESLRLGNGRWQRSEYNKRNQVTGIGLGFSFGDQDLLKLTFDYGELDNNGSLRNQTIDYLERRSPLIQSYQYDALNRLESAVEYTEFSEIWRETFEYDRFGNRTLDAANTSTLYQSDKISNPQIDSGSNRMIADQDGDSIKDYSYDEAGNLIVDAENRRFFYNAENQIKAFFKPGNSTETPDSSYDYDGNGRRVRKHSSDLETVFVYDAFGKLIAEYSNNAPVAPKFNYLTKDHLGSTRVITDGAGVVASRSDFMAFGESVTEKTGNGGGRLREHGYGAATDVRKKYTGYERDEESGLDFAQARYYNSSHGRFTSVDPMTSSASLRNPQTFNRYSYVLNSPYKFVDPLGLISQSTGACGQFCSNVIGGGFTGGTEFDSVSSSARALRTRSENRSVSNGNNQRNREDENSAETIEPPQPLIAEATAQLISVSLSGGGFEDEAGFLVMTPEMTEIWISALTDAFTRGVEVGAASAAASGVSATTGFNEGAGKSIDAGGTVGFRGATARGSASRSKSASVQTETITKNVVEMEANARAANTKDAMAAAGKLQDRQYEVSTATGRVRASADYGFFNTEFKRGIDLMYRRGVSMGASNTSGKPAVIDRTKVISN